GEANTLQALGDLHIRNSNLKDAENNYKAALNIFQTIDSKLGEANTLKALGDLHIRNDNLKDAENNYKAALNIFQTIDEKLGEANTLRALGDLHIRNDNLKDAENNYLEALNIYQTIDSKLGEANTTLCILRLSILFENEAFNIDDFEDIKHKYQNIGDNEGISDVFQVEMFYNLTQDQFEKAEDCFNECLKIKETTKNYLELKMWLKIYHKRFIDKKQTKQAEIINDCIEKVVSLIQA
ncbi:MAG: tetratricopeptide repeat protein, partial [Candidatus Cloacimonetes bacterium]|nr:tetratricopeptide repeat protein [Candidatus Cloacimonadota bacterium]